MTTEHSRFQLEASKLGRDVIFQVTVFEKEERKRKKLFAETSCADPFHLIIQFIIREAPDFDTLLQRFVRQLEHRGFAPIRMRHLTGGKWAEWQAVPFTGEGPPLPAVDNGVVEAPAEPATKPARGKAAAA